MSGSTNPGEPYGSLFTPESLGSGGSHGAGGGHLKLTVGSVFHVDGVISVAGEASTSGTGGGGSGGSILIEAYNMTGHGDLDASGGNGAGTNGGGGSGGRLGIEITFRNKFGGNYITRGGSAGQSSQESTDTAACRHQQQQGFCHQQDSEVIYNNQPSIKMKCIQYPI